MNYQHGNWYCKPQNEDEAKEILERAVASGAELHESVGADEDKKQYHWRLCSAWGVLEGKTCTGDAEKQSSPLAVACELTIQQTRKRFPLPSETAWARVNRIKVDWSKAPEDAQFYSYNKFRKYEDDNEYRWDKGTWLISARKDSLEWHKKQPDFELRPNKVDWSKAPDDAQFYSCRSFRKHESGDEYVWHETDWEVTGWDSLEWHKKQPDFGLRPDTVQSDVEHDDTRFTHEYKSNPSTYSMCAIVSDTKDKHGNIVVLNEHGFYKTIPQNEVRPIRTKRDEWVESALSTIPNEDNGLLRRFAESLYESMKDGTLEPPE